MKALGYRGLVGSLALLTLLNLPVHAGQPPLTEDGEINLGPIIGFSDETAALAACKPDGVVWADNKTGLYFPKFASEYGATPNGKFTCFRQAQRSNYWGTGPESTMTDKGRVFPFSPEPFCDYKVDKKTGKGFCAQPGA